MGDQEHLIPMEGYQHPVQADEGWVFMLINTSEIMAVQVKILQFKGCHSALESSKVHAVDPLVVLVYLY